MRDQLLTFKNQTIETWNNFSKKQKIMIGGAFLFILISLALIMYWASKPEYTPIYTNLSPSESGEIVTAIEGQGISARLSDDLTSISVPKAEAARLKAELSYQGIPRSGNVNYGIFSENMGFGTTERQFSVVERDAMQNELRYLIEQIDEIQQAKVMITLPQESVWLTDSEQTSTAAVIITTKPGTELSQIKINGLYHLISRSIPKLPVEQISIMNQHMQAYDLIDEAETITTLTLHQQQRQIKQDIERDIQRQLQQMLGRLLGMDNVVVSVFASVDFTKEQREEHLVAPVVGNNGIDISVERNNKSYIGESGSLGGLAGTGETDIAGYPGASDGSENSEYEELNERINREVNRIYKQIEASPYTITDLSISIGMEPPSLEEPNPITGEQIEDMVARVIGATIENGASLQPDELRNKVTVFTNQFKGRQPVVDEPRGIPNALLYGLAALAVLAIGATAFILIRRRGKEIEVEEEQSVASEPIDFDFDNGAEGERRRRIERLAKNQPEEFAKLLRTWLAED